MKYSFDSKCYDLAEHFLPAAAPESMKNHLAQEIQDTVEDYFSINEAAIEAIEPNPVPVCGRCENRHWPHCSPPAHPGSNP